MSNVSLFHPSDLLEMHSSKNATADGFEALMLIHKGGGRAWTFREGDLFCIFGVTHMRSNEYMLWSILPSNLRPIHARHLRRLLDDALREAPMSLIIEVDPAFPERENLAKFLGFTKTSSTYWRRSQCHSL